MTNLHINDLFSDSEQNKRCFAPKNNAERSAIQRLLKRGVVVRAYKNLYARAEYWNSLYESEKIRHIAASLIDIHPDWKLTSSSSAAMLGYQVMKDYDSEIDCASNADSSEKSVCAKGSSTKIYIRSANRKSLKYNNQLKVIPSVGYERDGLSDDVRVFTRGGNAGELLKLPHASDCVDDEIKSHLVDKSTMLLDVANNYSFRFALPIFDSAARDNVNLSKVIEICKDRCRGRCESGRGRGGGSGREHGRGRGCVCRRGGVGDNTDSISSNNKLAKYRESANYRDLDELQRRYESDSCASLEDLRNYAKTNGGTRCSLSFEQIFVDEQDEFAKLRALCYFADGDSENGGESLARGTMIKLGFMIPKLQNEFVIPRLNLKYRCDFLWRISSGELIVGEFDGYSKYYIDPTAPQYKNVNLNSSQVNKNLFDARDQSVIHKNIDKQAEREALLMKECGVSRIVRFNYSEVLDSRKLEKKLVAAGVPRIMWK